MPRLWPQPRAFQCRSQVVSPHELYHHDKAQPSLGLQSFRPGFPPYLPFLIIDLHKACLIMMAFATNSVSFPVHGFVSSPHFFEQGICRRQSPSRVFELTVFAFHHTEGWSHSATSELYKPLRQPSCLICVLCHRDYSGLGECILERASRLTLFASILIA